MDFDGLTSETCYQAEVLFGTQTTSVPAYANFTTAPEDDVMRPVTFAWGGDIAGQNICRDADEGFPIFKALKAVGELDFFVGLGDAVYGELIITPCWRVRYDRCLLPVVVRQR